jgi:hypothetical protein
MGYDVHITRADRWTHAESSPITLDEWLAYVRSDPEMRLDGYADAPLSDGSVLRAESPGLSVWTEYSGDGHDSNHAWFDWEKGRVVVKNPDEEILRKMHVIAVHFGARVQGDEGETYDETGCPE